MKRIYLRALEPEDYKISIKWRNDPEIQNMIGGPKFYVSSETEKKWVSEHINNPHKLVLAICLKNNDKYIGNVIIKDIDWRNRSAQGAILIGEKDEWGHGYGTEARIESLCYAFQEMGLERVWSLVLENNLASLKMLQKCGYKKEGVLRKSVFKNGQFYNQIMLSILKEEFEERFDVISTNQIEK